MDTLDFLQRVLPSTGIYVTATVNSGSHIKHRYLDSIEELAQTIKNFASNGDNTYYAVSSYITKDSRKQTNVQATKLLALDIDVGKERNSYDTAQDALKAIGQFIKDTGLPKPMIVQSGNGFHVYWVMDEALPPEQWTPLAQAFKKLALRSDLIIDPAIPADSARILRPVGTVHPNGREVKVILEGGVYTVEELSSCISKHVNVSVAPTGPRKDTGLLGSLAIPNDMPVCVATVAERKCLQIANAIDNPDTVPEPLWYLLLGVAAYTDEPEEAAKRWSQGHPEYDESSTLRKMVQWKDKTTGPSLCDKFKEHNPEGCKKCPYKDKISTPAQLGKQYKEVEVIEEAPDEIAQTIQIPKPFKRTADGIKLTIDETDIDICPFDIYPVGYGKDFSLGYETVRFHWKRPHVGWKELIFRQAYLADGSREFPTAIADQGIVLNNKKQTEYFQLMLRSYMEELRKQRAVTNLYASMGWKENYTQFVLGDTVFRREPDGSVTEEVITLSSGIQRQSNELYTTGGTLPQWSKLAGLLSKFDMSPQMVAFAIGASAPLYALSSLKGITVSLCGETGAGKTLTQILIQSLYGNPEKLHFAARFTQNVVYTRMGTYANLPFTIDEGSVIAPKDLGDLVYCVPQGRDKARLNRNADEREAKEWALPNIISTNKPMQELLFNSTMVGDAQMARMIELQVSQHPLFAKDSEAGRKMYLAILDNHGHAGREVIKELLAMGEEKIKDKIAKHYKVFADKYSCKFSGHERFWEQALVLGDLMMTLMRKWNLINFDHAPAFEWVVKTLGNVREEIKDNRLDAFDMLTGFLADHTSSIATIIHTSADPMPITMENPKLMYSGIRARFDVYRKTKLDSYTHGTLMLDRTKLREWMHERGYDYTSFQRELKTERILATPKSGKFSLGKNTELRLGQSYVVGVSLNHPRLTGMLTNIEDQYLNLAPGEMQLLSASN